MTPRAFLLSPAPVACDDLAADLAPLGLRSLAAVLGAVEARGVVLPGIDAEHSTAADARRALPAVLRAALDALATLEDDARAAHAASGHGHRHVAAVHRTAAETCQALAFELHAAAKASGVPIGAREAQS